jgi:hypothetical protein
LPYNLNMSHFFIQLEKKVSPWLALVVWPLLFILVLCSEGLWKYNFTGLLTDSPHHVLYRIAFACILAWLVRTLYRLSFAHARKVLFAFAFTAILALFTPYLHGQDFITNLHLAFSFAAFLFFNGCFLSLLQYRRNLLLFYFCLLLTCILLVITAGAVTGIAELIYAVCTSILLGILLIQ